MFALHRDASFGWSKATPGYMHKNSAPQSLDAGRYIVIQHDDEIVKAVVAPKSFMACGIGELYFAVVVPVMHRDAPSIGGTDGLKRHSSEGTSNAVGPVK